MSTTSDTISLKKAQKENNVSAQGAETGVKKKKAKKANTDAKNREAIKGSARKAKDLMYLYKDQKTGDPIEDDDKKKYRAQARKKADSYTKKLKKEKDPAAHAKLLKFAVSWAKKTYTEAHRPEFK
jgi:hypothetical protein